MEEETSQHSGKWAGHLALLAANGIWGGMAPVSKDLLNAGVIDGWTLAGVRIIGGAILFWLLGLVLPKSWIGDGKIRRQDFFPLLGASVLVIAANQTLTILGMSYTSPIDATVVCSMTPIFTLVLGFLFLRQKISWLKALGVALGFTGILLFIFASQSDETTHVVNPMLGNTLCFLAQLCGACYLVFFLKVISRYSAFTLMKWLFLLSAVLVAPFILPDICAVQWSQMPLNCLFDTAYIVVLATCLTYLLIPVAQKRVAPTVVAMYNYLQPVVSALISIVAGLAVLDVQTALFTLLIFVSVWLVSKH